MIIGSNQKRQRRPGALLPELPENVSQTRYDPIVRELASDAQLLLVTHNKKTMELAQRMYGVTMAEPGISSVIATDLAPGAPEPELIAEPETALAG